MANISICVVTFKERLEDIKRLLSQIQNDNKIKGVDIILAVNGNNDESMPDNYRQEMLKLASETPNCYPIVCAEYKSLPKLWNTLTIFSKTKYNFIICDDVEYTSPTILTEIETFTKNTRAEFFTINGGFSHFVLTKQKLHELGYFDERLIAHGEEDGDIVHRYIKRYGTRIPAVSINGIINKGSYEPKFNNKNIDCHTTNKPTFNREFVKQVYQDDPFGITGMNPTPLSIKECMEIVKQYPYEMFVLKNKHQVAKFDKIIMEFE
tara:strand:- start:5463 stop:6257 length:795 start_codon:yes stop_codon:yes gene_type:complete